MPTGCLEGMLERMDRAHGLNCEIGAICGSKLRVWFVMRAKWPRYHLAFATSEPNALRQTKPGTSVKKGRIITASPDDLVRRIERLIRLEVWKTVLAGKPPKA